MAITTISLPDTTGRCAPYALRGEPLALAPRRPARSRVALAAAHVVANPFADAQPGEEVAIDWPATLAFRRHLFDQGLGIAEAMDTAQRGMGLGWDTALELVRRTCAEFGANPPAPLFAGAGTDHLATGTASSLDEVADAYLLQVEMLQDAGARLIVMASRELARLAQGPDCYARVYARVLAACDEPVILHWLGDMFDPQLAGYWGADRLAAAADSCQAITHAHAAKVDGIKVSLLDADVEIALRRRLPDGVRLYTGDDFNYPQLIAGDECGHSDALLGIFNPIAPAAAAALAALDAGNTAGFHALLDPTVPLARLLFAAPTYHYKVGIVFLAWLNGHQPHFTMVGGAQGMRPLPYFTGLFRHADACGLLADPELAVTRMREFLAVHGVRA